MEHVQWMTSGAFFLLQDVASSDGGGIDPAYIVTTLVTVLSGVVTLFYREMRAQYRETKDELIACRKESAERAEKLNEYGGKGPELIEVAQNLIRAFEESDQRSSDFTSSSRDMPQSDQHLQSTASRRSPKRRQSE